MNEDIKLPPAAVYQIGEKMSRIFIPTNLPDYIKPITAYIADVCREKDFSMRVKSGHHQQVESVQIDVQESSYSGIFLRYFGKDYRTFAKNNNLDPEDTKQHFKKYGTSTTLVRIKEKNPYTAKWLGMHEETKMNFLISSIASIDSVKSILVSNTDTVVKEFNKIPMTFQSSVFNYMVTEHPSCNLVLATCIDSDCFEVINEYNFCITVNSAELMKKFVCID